MCDWKQEASKIWSRLKGMALESVFPAEFIQHRPPGSVSHGHCLACDRPLSKQEMFPPGRPARYMCQSCYEAAAYGDAYHCLWCGQPLPQDLVWQRQSNPRELKYAFHQGPCLDYHKALAGIVLGVAPEQRQSRALGYDPAIPLQPTGDNSYAPMGMAPQLDYQPMPAQRPRGSKKTLFLPLPWSKGRN